MSENNGSIEFPPRAVARNVGQLAHDVVVLAELQTQLLKVDTQDYLKRAAKPLAAVLFAIIVALGCVPVALATLALCLVNTGLPQWAAFVIATVVGLLIAVTCGVVGWVWSRKSFAAFSRSNQEFQNNILWLKRALKKTSPDSSRIARQT